uniref:HOOK N-terminal domain-containing protein n=1 Tax=Trichuris muris TaxID=70415 RepID=A0A5S6Q832_TRIMR
MEQCLLNWVNLELQKFGESIDTLEAKTMFSALGKIIKTVVNVKPEDSGENAVLSVLSEYYGDKFIQSVKQEGEKSSWKCKGTIAKITVLLMNFVLMCANEEFHLKMVMENMNHNDVMRIIDVCFALEKNVHTEQSELNSNWLDMLKEDEKVNHASPTDGLNKNNRLDGNYSRTETSPQSSQSSTLSKHPFQSYNMSSKYSSTATSMLQHISPRRLTEFKRLRKRVHKAWKLEKIMREVEQRAISVKAQNAALREAWRLSQKKISIEKAKQIILLKQRNDMERSIAELRRANTSLKVKVISLEERIKCEKEVSKMRQELRELLLAEYNDFGNLAKYASEMDLLGPNTNLQMDSNLAVRCSWHSTELMEVRDLIRKMKLKLEQSKSKRAEFIRQNEVLAKQCVELELVHSENEQFKKFVTEKLLCLTKIMTSHVSNLETIEQMLNKCRKLALSAIKLKMSEVCEDKSNREEKENAQSKRLPIALPREGKIEKKFEPANYDAVTVTMETAPLRRKSIGIDVCLHDEDTSIQ